MCQFLCCDCWWFNFCGIPCGGLHVGICLCSFWLCKPIELQTIDPDFCKLCAFDGLGFNACCFGTICCASDFVRMWSKRLSAGPGGITNVVVNQSWLMFSIYDSNLSENDLFFNRFIVSQMNLFSHFYFKVSFVLILCKLYFYFKKSVRNNRQIKGKGYKWIYKPLLKAFIKNL